MIDFRTIARRHLQGKCFAFEERRCPDQFVGVISEIERSREFTCRLAASDRPPNLPCVLLVLESPHTSEFDDHPGPAKGGTGRNIIRFLHDALETQDKQDLGLLLVNAVQFQCSLGCKTSEVRDAVFLDIWASGGRTDFEDRLQTLYRDGDYVVNCCTRGSSKNTAAQLRAKVHQGMVETLPPGTRVLRRNHPSSWHFPANRTREWAYAI